MQLAYTRDYFNMSMVTYIDNDHPNTTDLTSSLQCATKFCQLLSFSIKTGRQKGKRRNCYLVAIKVNKASSSGREVSPGSKATRALRNRSFNSCKNKLHRFWTHSVDNFGQGRTPSRFCPPDVFGLRGKGEREGRERRSAKENTYCEISRRLSLRVMPRDSGFITALVDTWPATRYPGSWLALPRAITGPPELIMKSCGTSAHARASRWPCVYKQKRVRV